ncbi:SDR family oxidoreductase [Olivibacter sitiensis]|uniref:SDR family oxidoreductase n=1 Tax=Olivibacter sitiensis TaxID=376470 RepID=UPI000411B0B7|nr:SDR family oxidoreductase [Olivibacter sitiensis]
MDLGLKDKVILVTGGAKGIGRGIVDALAREGALPIIIGRNERDNEQARQELMNAGYQVATVLAELTRPEACEMAVREAVEKYGRIDGLVNNAGVNDNVSLAEGTYASFMDSLHKSLVHYYLMAHFALPELKKNGGSILNIGSKVAETGQGGTSGYAASNGARNALTREWAVELLPHQVRVNAIIVAECWTPLYEKWLASLPDGDEKLETITRNIPLGRRMTTSQEIADMAVFLLSPRSSHTTGQLIHVDGGYVHLDRGI